MLCYMIIMLQTAEEGTKMTNIRNCIDYNSGTDVKLPLPANTVLLS